METKRKRKKRVNCAGLSTRMASSWEEAKSVTDNAMRTPTLESINRDRRMRGDQEIEVWQAAVAYLIALYARRTSPGAGTPTPDAEAVFGGREACATAIGGILTQDDFKDPEFMSDLHERIEEYIGHAGEPQIDCLSEDGYAVGLYAWFLKNG